MTAPRNGSSFIRYELPRMASGKPSNPGGSPRPSPVTTQAVGEESGSERPGGVTSMAVGEESGSSR